MRTQSLPTLFDRFFADLEAPVRRPEAAFQPALDLVERPDRYELTLDLPGTPRESVDVEFDEGALAIRGERAAEATPEDGRVHWRERRAGRFERRVAFRDEVAVDAITATYRDGVLRVVVPKSERARPRQIPVAVH
jgi:HSP20 family protein